MTTVPILYCNLPERLFAAVFAVLTLTTVNLDIVGYLSLIVITSSRDASCFAAMLWFPEVVSALSLV